MSTCLLFDCDGTLVDSEILGMKALALEFEALGLRLDRDLLVQKYRGSKLANIVADISNKHDLLVPADFEECFRSRMKRLFDAELKPIPGIKDCLGQLNYAKAVVSSGPLSKIKHALDLCGLSEFFGSNIMSAYEIKIWKPDPGIYLHAAQVMNSRPEDCIVVEDGLVGIEAGLGAGMKAVFYNPENQASCPHGAEQISSMSQLPELIERLKS